MKFVVFEVTMCSSNDLKFQNTFSNSKIALYSSPCLPFGKRRIKSEPSSFFIRSTSLTFSVIIHYPWVLLILKSQLLSSRKNNSSSHQGQVTVGFKKLTQNTLPQFTHTAEP